MAFSIQTNVNSLIAQENLRVNSDFQAKTIQQLTSGYRINQSGDDAAGLAVANTFRNNEAELTQGVRNANDGISTLQIVDGGMNNISTMLDRMKTLATQSASSSFTGNRATLDAEFQSLQAEITRQAADIGLTNGGANQKILSVYLGGGAAGGGASVTSNSTVSVDLSTASVDAAGLNVNGLSINGTSSTTAQVVAAGAATLAASGNLAGATQQIDVDTSAGTTTVTLTGGATGLSQDDVIQQLNAGLAGTGITAAIGTGANANKVVFSSGDGFVLDIKDATNSATGIGPAAIAQNTGMAHTGMMTFANAATPENLTFTLTGGSGAVKTVAIGAATTADQFQAAAQTALAGTGIEVMRDGNDFYFQGSQTFTLASDAAFANFSNGPNGTVTAGAGTVVSDPTTNAKAALTAITAAVQTLGTVQGTVGAGENKLQYAINLAESQNTNYASAESRIRDTDVAAQAANLTKASVLQQASMAAMAQANSASQAVLALLRG